MEQKNETQAQKYRVAVLECKEVYESQQYEDICRFIAERLTEWAEVTEEEFNALNWYCSRNYSKLRLIVHHDHQPILLNAVSDYLKWAEQEKKREEKRKEDAAKRAKKEAEQAESRKKKRIEKLAAEAGLKVVPKTE